MLYNCINESFKDREVSVSAEAFWFGRAGNTRCVRVAFDMRYCPIVRGCSHTMSGAHEASNCVSWLRTAPATAKITGISVCSKRLTTIMTHRCDLISIIVNTLPDCSFRKKKTEQYAIIYYVYKYCFAPCSGNIFRRFHLILCLLVQFKSAFLISAPHSI